MIDSLLKFFFILNLFILNFKFIHLFFKTIYCIRVIEKWKEYIQLAKLKKLFQSL